MTMHNYTPEDLICYLYKETTPEQTSAIEEALQNNWTLREKMAVLKTAHERLNTLMETPRTQVVLNILKYANTTETISS